MEYWDKSRKHWTVSGTFPVRKSTVYPEHHKAQEFDLWHGKNILEYACGGSGSDALEYLERGNNLTCLDIIQENLDNAEINIRNAGGNMDEIDFILLECSWDIPFEDNSFDVVNAGGVLHHIELHNQPKVIQELHRILKPQGIMYTMIYTRELEEILKPHIENFMKQYNVSYETASGYATDGVGAPFSSFYSEDEWKELVEPFGFELLQTVVYNARQFRTFKFRKI